MIFSPDLSSLMHTVNLIAILDQIEIYFSMPSYPPSNQASNMKQKYSSQVLNAEMHLLILNLKVLFTSRRLKLYRYKQLQMLSHSLSIFKSVMSSTEQLLNSTLPLSQFPPLNSSTILCPTLIASLNQSLNSMP